MPVVLLERLVGGNRLGFLLTPIGRLLRQQLVDHVGQPVWSFRGDFLERLVLGLGNLLVLEDFVESRNQPADVVVEVGVVDVAGAVEGDGAEDGADVHLGAVGEARWEVPTGAGAEPTATGA